MYANFGEIGAAIKTLVDQFQDKQKSQAQIETIADMKVRRFHLYLITTVFPRKNGTAFIHFARLDPVAFF